MIYPYKLRLAYGCDELLIEIHPIPNKADFIDILNTTLAELKPNIRLKLIDNIFTHDAQIYKISTNQGKAELSMTIWIQVFL